jgi:threonine dehydratase
MKSFEISLADLWKAREVLSQYLEPTPLVSNAWLSQEFGCDLYLKLENMQPIGSFKIRGATHKIATLAPEEKSRGVIAASAGNHAQGVAWGSAKLGVKATIVMPRSAVLTKVQNTRSLGAEVILEGDTYDQAFEAAQRICKERGLIYVHAFEDRAVIAGQGTIGLELLDQLPEVDFVVGAMGGGGLMAGISIAIKELKPQVQLVGCQASGAPAMLRSLQQKKAIVLDEVNTFADGIAIARTSDAVRELLQPRIDHLVEEDDEGIAAAVLMLMEKAKIVAEGSGALPLAGLEKLREKVRGKKVVLLVGGGNIDVNVLGRIIDRGLIRAGRRVRLTVLLSDRPGSLARLTALIAQEGASVIQAIHDRNESSTRIDQTQVALTLETKGADHSKRLIEAITSQVLRVELAP